MKPLRSFASDNNAGIHPDILKAIAMVNQGHVVGYGADPYTAIKNKGAESGLQFRDWRWRCGGLRSNGYRS